MDIGLAVAIGLELGLTVLCVLAIIFVVVPVVEYLVTKFEGWGF